MSVMIVTSLGDLVVDLFTDRCPLTCKNFLKLCKIKYYNGCLFHTVQKDFTAQTGDPTGTGSGGDSVYKVLYGDQARFFGDEIHLDLKHSKKGTVAMASAGENLNASQFYVTLRDDLDYLDGKHTVFGEVAEGIDTLDRINEAFIDEKGRPFKNIRVKHTYILDDPFDDPPQLVELIPDASPEGKPKDEVDDDVRLEDDWVPMDETLGTQEIEEVLRAKEAHSRAVVLESIGDIPDAEIKPPDNVLFVCKLNPVTEDEDLYTIFSRFGTVTSAEIIRDYKTGDSLCYAFIEFEDKEACEQAYFKMDNALIDDRRIHVDFSQSVAKYWFQYRNRKDQMGKGGGCFKCGSLDHIAKDCTANSTQQHHPKYILKEDNRQHGGDDNSRFEMVFDEDAGGSPRGNKRQQDYGAEKDDGKQNVKRKTYRVRVHNVGVSTSLNFRIQNHNLLLVETEGTYTSQQNFSSLDIHVGQSYTFLVTMDQNASTDYYIVASARFVNESVWQKVTGVAVLHYSNSKGKATGPLPDPPNDVYDKSYSMNQALSIRQNVSASGARPNPQGSFHYGAVNVTDAYILRSIRPGVIGGELRATYNGLSFDHPKTPIRLADLFHVPREYKLDFPNNPVDRPPRKGKSIINGTYKGFIEIILQNNDTNVQSFHMDGYSFFVVGMGYGDWTENSRGSYNRWDAISRCTTQVFAGGWTAILAYLDNVGVWNLRTENLDRWYLGQETYIRITNPEDTDNKTEDPAPDNVLYCGALAYKQKAQKTSSATTLQGISEPYLSLLLLFFAILYIL